MDIKFEVIKKVAETKFKYRDLKISKLDSNSPPTIFVGSQLRYPLVNVGILSPLDRDENAWIYDDAKYWADNNFQIKDVIGLREGLLNSRFLSKVQDSRMNKKFVQIAQEIAIASKPVDIEIELKHRLKLDKKRDKILTPHGMRGGLKKAKITSNVKIHRKVDKVINDEIKASEGIDYLYKNNFDEYTLQKILSVGVLGLKKNKRFVPTKWSITATDDTIGKNLINEVKQYQPSNYLAYFGSYLGNFYLVLFFPDIFSYELFETYVADCKGYGIYKTDYEDYFGRKDYAKETVGGYYAARLGILEEMKRTKRQASTLTLRFITDEYWAHLGVWVVREQQEKQ